MTTMTLEGIVSDRGKITKSVLLIEDHPICRVATKMILDSQDVEIEAYGVDTVAAALDALLQGRSFDLIVYDWTLPGGGGVKGLIAVSQMAPRTPVVVVSANDEEAVRRIALDVGARAFLLKTVEPVVLRDELRRWLNLAPQTICGDMPSPSQKVVDNKIKLTLRQQAVLLEMAEGYSNKLIARKLSIAVTTVRTHVSEILRVLGAQNRTEAIVKARKVGLLDRNLPILTLS